MFLERKPYLSLLEWKKLHNSKPLIVRGARQVGKTRLVEEFGKTEFENVVLLNFEREKSLKKIFEGDLNIKKILSRIEVTKGKVIQPQKTLLFLDEIQQCPEAVLALRYLHEETPDLHVIGAGSLLDFALENISFPVGRVTFLNVFPLGFSEFLKAVGRGDLVKELPHLSTLTGGEGVLPAAGVLYEHLKDYLVVGGMPEAVVSFLKTGSFQRVKKIHQDLIESFVDDMGKYAKGDKQLANIELVFRRAFRFLAQEITYSTILEGENIQRTSKSLDLLQKARLLHRVVSTSPGNLPLAAHTHEKHFKCLFLDVGLGQTLSGISAHEVLDGRDLLKTFEGRIAEQFVGQELLCETEAASEGGSLYCWMRQSKSAKAEVDYLLSRKGKVIPIEVKAGKSGKLRSLSVLQKEYSTVKKCVTLSHTETISSEAGLLRLPLFTVLD